MVQIRLEDITVELYGVNGSVHLKSLYHSDVILTNQTVENVYVILNENFNIVSTHYYKIYDNELIKSEDIQILSFRIVMHYLYMYNQWQTIYKNQERRDLTFNKTDFANASTHDIIFDYFKTKYPLDWEQSSVILLEIDIASFKTYYKEREYFYNK